MLQLLALSTLLAAQAATAPAPATTPAPAAAPAPSPVRLLILDFEAVGVEPKIAKSVDSTVLAAVGEVRGVEAIAQQEMRKLAALEQAKEEVGCDSASCLAELAQALGAQLVLFGGVSELGGTTTVTLSLYDARTMQIARDSIVVARLGDLPSALPKKVRALVEAGRGPWAAEPVAVAPPPVVEEEPDWLGFLGTVLVAAGGTAVVGGGIYAALQELTIEDPKAAGSTKRDAQAQGVVGLGVVGGGVLLAAVGGTMLALDALSLEDDAANATGAAR